MMHLQNIEKYFFRNTPNEVQALKQVNLLVQPDEFVVLLGSNGSGKSTLLNCIAGSCEPDGGTISVDEMEITNYKEHQRSPWISRVFQNPLMGTASELSIVENFRLAALRASSKKFTVGIDEKFRKHVREQISQLKLGLENKLDQPMGGLSGGQRQALTLLMAVMDTTKIILLDEPASALDPKTAELIMKLAEQLIRKHQLMAILVTHNLKEALNYGDRIIILKEGTIAHNLDKRSNHNLTAAELLEKF